MQFSKCRLKFDVVSAFSLVHCSCLSFSMFFQCFAELFSYLFSSIVLVFFLCVFFLVLFLRGEREVGFRIQFFSSFRVCQISTVKLALLLPPLLHLPTPSLFPPSLSPFPHHSTKCAVLLGRFDLFRTISKVSFELLFVFLKYFQCFLFYPVVSMYSLFQVSSF